MKNSARPTGQAGFSLVEVTIAVGLFAFGVVGVIGLFPTALAQRAEAARDTRARLIAEQIFEALRGSDNDALRSGGEIILPPFVKMGAEEGENVPGEGDLRQKSTNGLFPFCLGFGELGTTVIRDISGDQMWKEGVTGEARDSVYIALVSREQTGTPGLYKVDVQVGVPASLPALKRRNLSFSSLVYMP
jgi:hypothetical protein